MPEHTFIQLGLSHEGKIDNAVDLRGNTSFREAMALLKHASAFVGVVSSFAHTTNALNKPGVVLLGASTPIVWGYLNNINILKVLPALPAYSC